jgi:hypothetical protein
MYFSPVSEGFGGFQRVSEFVSNGGRDDPDPARCRPPYARGGGVGRRGPVGRGGSYPPPSHVTIIIISLTLRFLMAESLLLLLQTQRQRQAPRAWSLLLLAAAMGPQQTSESGGGEFPIPGYEAKPPYFDVLVSPPEEAFQGAA